MDQISLSKKNQFLKNNYSRLWLAINHHRTHRNKPITFNKHLYLKKIYIDKSDYIVIIKSTQCGISEYAIVYVVDFTSLGYSAFYVLPTDPIKNRFVQNRFDRSVIFTPYYQSLLREAPDINKAASSVSLKHISGGTVAFAGSNTPAPFAEFPADILIVDEYDLCDLSHVIMGEERLSHSDFRHELYISNPTITDYGIESLFKDTNQQEWENKCCNCNKYVRMDFFKNVVREIDVATYALLDTEWDESCGRDIHVICDKCNKPMDRFTDGEWIENNFSYRKSGYHIHKLFSSNASIINIVDRFNRGLSNDEIMQRVYNADFGRGYTAPGAKITSELLNNCIKDFHLPPNGNNTNVSDKLVVMGIDVGTRLHVRINEVKPDHSRIPLYIGIVNNYDDIVELHRNFNVKLGVIDAQPETRFSKKVVATLSGMFMCFYGDVKRDIIDPKYRIITVDRTSSLDAIKEMLILHTINLPKNVASIPEYYSHMQSLTRVYNEASGKYRWIGDNPDHFFHAENYALIAQRLMIMLMGRGK